LGELEIPAAEPVELTPEQARELTDRIRAGVTNLLPVIKEAFERRADRALGYESWHAYCDAELDGIRLPIERRRAHVAELRGQGMSTRAIGAALGVSEGTVRNDLSTAQDYAVEQPEQVRSLDDRRRPATRPARSEASDPEAVDSTVLPGTVDQPRVRTSDDPAVEESEPTAALAATGEPVEPQPWAPERPAADRGRAAVQQMVEEERQKGEYLRNFRAALTKSGSAWIYDAERVGREASPETFTAIEANVSAAVHWLETARRARSGLRVIRGGVS
jgi:hypothetical protein